MSKPPTITTETVIRRIQDIVSADLDGEVVMMSIEQGNYYGMDEIGSRIWELLETPLSVSALCDLLMQEYDVSREQCERETLRFLNEVAEEKLLKVVE